MDDRAQNIYQNIPTSPPILKYAIDAILLLFLIAIPIIFVYTMIVYIKIAMQANSLIKQIPTTINEKGVTVALPLIFDLIFLLLPLYLLSHR
jgi:hypothetical protein